MSRPGRECFYGRMFPPTAWPVDEKGEMELRLLGEGMIATQRRDRFGPVAGITYFGQFVDHDLTYDTTPLEQRSVEPCAVRNFRSPRLDLELIYGGEPTRSPHLYEGDRLKLGLTAGIPGTQFPGGTARDIARRSDHFPLHADPNDTRNLENLLIMQIHVLFIKFHNAAVEQCNAPAFSGLPLPEDRFGRAQQLVRWHYQWLVREYFLREIARADIFRDYDSPDRKIEWQEEGFYIPAEFSLAAFRFGHSMVRDVYTLNCHHHGVPLADLIALTKRAEPLREDWLVEWGRLFRGLRKSGSRVTPSASINTAIVAPLHRLDEYPPRKPNAKAGEAQPPQLPVRTLLRGARAGLPSGQEVGERLVAEGLLNRADLMDRDRLLSTVDTTNDQSRRVLAEHPKLLERTPLYYYLLKEAEVLGAANHTLGPIGSRMVIEVIQAILVADESSYFNAPGLGPNWRLPLWRFRDGDEGRIDSMTSLVRMLGDDLPQGCNAMSRRPE